MQDDDDDDDDEMEKGRKEDHEAEFADEELDLDAVANDFIGRCSVRQNTSHV